MPMGTSGYEPSFRELLFDRSPRATHLRRRGGAAGGAALLFLGLLTALGLAPLALGVLLVGLVVATVWVVRDQERRERLRARFGQRSGGLVTTLRARSTSVAKAAPEIPPADDDAAAGYRCQALGTLLRRRGRPEDAATLHAAARLLFAESGDRRGEAVATNGLGLALFSAGEQDASFAQFEQARRLMRSVGDREREGRVTANLGLAKLRSGAIDEAAELLRAALEELTPGTPEYRRVEERLREASQ
jgi:tetratricopeptide (TPR) repeat protein